MKIKSALFGLFALLFATAAQAQTSPNWTDGYVPSAAEWNTLFGSKQDFLGSPPLLLNGGTMVGEIITAPSATSSAGFNLAPGVAPTSPINGDLWTTTAGLFARISGVTVGPFLSGGSPTFFTATSPITVSFPGSGVTNYACATCGVTGSPLSQFASTTSAQLAGIISDETGSGGLVFANNASMASLTVATAFTATGLVTVTDLANQAANTVLGALTATHPSALTVPSCSGTTTNALNWTSGTGFGCQVIAPTTNQVTNTMLAQGAAATLKMNATAATANETDSTIQGLTNLAAPSGTLDFIPIFDHVSGTIKNVTPGAIASSVVAGVASIDAQTGVFTTGNGIDSSGKVIELTAARRTLPTKTILSGSGTYTTPANVLWLEVYLVGGGGGGSSAAAGGTGGSTCWNTTGAACTSSVISAGGGFGNAGGQPGPGGTVSGTNAAACMISAPGGQGGVGTQTVNGSGMVGSGGGGGLSSLGGGGGGGLSGTAQAGGASTGGGGGGGGVTATSTAVNSGSGGGSGATCYFIQNSPAATYTYAIGVGGTAAPVSGVNSAGGNGGSGMGYVIEHYGT